MSTQLLAVAVGFALLAWGAERFVAGAASAARLLGVSPLLIGLTIVGFGTSAPEILISLVAALQGNTSLAVGNAIGSNITNIALILGATAVIMPLAVHSSMVRRELPVLIATTLLVWWLLADGELNYADGLVLMAGLLALIVWIIRLGLAQRNGGDPMAAEYEAEIRTDLSMTASLFWVAAGLVVLVASSRILVWGAVGMAEVFGISELVIGLTIVALGTSLPELAASVAGALKNEHDIAIGNVVGSNMFNLLAVLGLPGLIHPAVLEGEVASRDIPVMIGLSVALLLMAYEFRGRGRRISRLEGALLLAVYVGYQTLLYFTARN